MPELLRDVVTEAGEDHVVGAVRRAVGRRRCTGCTGYTCPSLTAEVAVLHLVLETAVLGAVVEAVGESCCRLIKILGCAKAVRRSSGAVGRIARDTNAAQTRGRGGRQGFGVATRVGAGDRSVAYELTGICTDGAEVGSTLRVLFAPVTEQVTSFVTG